MVRFLAGSVVLSLMSRSIAVTAYLVDIRSFDTDQFATPWIELPILESCITARPYPHLPSIFDLCGIFLVPTNAKEPKRGSQQAEECQDGAKKREVW